MKKYEIILIEKNKSKSLYELLPDSELHYLLTEWTKFEFDCLVSKGWDYFERLIKKHQHDIYIKLHTDEEKILFAKALASQYALERVYEPLHKICEVFDIDLVNTLLNEYQLVD